MTEHETKRALCAQLKQLAKAEMARGLGKRHGREIRLPWDENSPVEPAEDPTRGGLSLDNDALGELARNFVG